MILSIIMKDVRSDHISLSFNYLPAKVYKVTSLLSGLLLNDFFLAIIKVSLVAS